MQGIAKAYVWGRIYASGLYIGGSKEIINFNVIPGKKHSAIFSYFLCFLDKLSRAAI
jgi:hypothetical protein